MQRPRRKKPRLLRPRMVLGLHLWLMLLVSLATGARLVAQEGDVVVWARPERAEPPSPHYEGPPMGSVYSPSEVIYPPQQMPLRFFHDAHVHGYIPTKCVDCHEQALHSVKASDDLLPEMEVCLDCHVLEIAENTDIPSDCTTCHTSYLEEQPRFPAHVKKVTSKNFREVENYPDLPHIPAPNIIFPHKAHVDDGIECSVCHTDMKGIDVATRLNLPTMNLCLTCHTNASDTPSDKCSTCHMTQSDGRLKTSFAAAPAPSFDPKVGAKNTDIGRLDLSFDIPPIVVDSNVTSTLKLMPQGRFRGDDHRLDYIKKHRRVTTADEAYCATCHTQAYCLDCHNGVFKPPTIHPPNYAQTHALDAYRDNPQCSSCHTRQDFCITCHQQVGVAVPAAVDRQGSGSAGFAYHPPNWIAQGHSVAAQRNMGSCVSCHNEQTCLNCHSTQAPIFQQNPHPADWLARCSSLYTRNQTACLKCHRVNDPRLQMCQ